MFVNDIKMVIKT